MKTFTSCAKRHLSSLFAKNRFFNRRCRRRAPLKNTLNGFHNTCRPNTYTNIQMHRFIIKIQKHSKMKNAHVRNRSHQCTASVAKHSVKKANSNSNLLVIDIDIVIVMILNILIAMANELTSANLAMPSQYMLYLLLPLLPTQLPSPNHPSHRWPLQPFAT